MTRQIVSTALLLLVTVVFFEYSSIDVQFQDALYNFELQSWILDREDAITKFVFYDGIKKLFILLVLSFLSALLFFRKTKLVQEYKHGLIIVCLSALLVPAVVGALKATTNVPCPKHLQHYGGSYPYVTVLSEYPAQFRQTKKIKCYPAGHASGAFALLSLFFLFKRNRNKILALLSTLVIGWTIGAYKMLIGDHFLSHTVVTMFLAWLIILMIAKIVYARVTEDKMHSSV